MNQEQAGSQWLYQLWRWNADNGVTVDTEALDPMTNYPSDRGKRVGDFRLMDQAQDAKERRAIAAPKVHVGKRRVAGNGKERARSTSQQHTRR